MWRGGGLVGKWCLAGGRPFPEGIDNALPH